MAILTYSAGAPLQGFYAWAQEHGVPPAVPCPTGDLYTLLSQRLTRGTYAEAGDVVRYSAFLASGDAVMNFGGQWANDAGVYKRYSQSLAVSAGSSPARVTAPASAGWYRDAAVSLETGGITGQTLYVTQELGRTNGGAFAPIAMLAQGWLTSAAPVSDGPNSPPDVGGGGGSGGGCCIGTLFDDVWDPDADTMTIPVPAGAAGRVVYVSSRLVASGVAADRVQTLELLPASGFGFVDVGLVPVTAGQSKGFAWQAGGPTFTHPQTGDYYRGLPENLWFDSDFVVQISHSHKQAGDNQTFANVTWEIKGP